MALGDDSRAPGKPTGRQEVATGGCARRTQLLLLLAEEEDGRGVAVVDWARWLGRKLGRPGGLHG